MAIEVAFVAGAAILASSQRIRVAEPSDRVSFTGWSTARASRKEEWAHKHLPEIGRIAAGLPESDMETFLDDLHKAYMAEDELAFLAALSDWEATANVYATPGLGNRLRQGRLEPKALVRYSGTRLSVTTQETDEDREGYSERQFKAALVAASPVIAERAEAAKARGRIGKEEALRRMREALDAHS